MNRIIILLTIFLFAGYWALGQATPVERYRIANKTIAMGVNLPTGTQVFDVAGQKLYIALRPVPSTITIQIGLEAIDPYFKEFAFAPEIPRAPDGTVVVELVSSSGRIWMDRNLGASQAATSGNDYKAYGSLFQWCRAADGHEKINWTKSYVGTPVNSAIRTLSTSTSPGHSLFILSSGDWLSTQQPDGRLWWNGTTAGANNPCPTGYHVPTMAEWEAERALFASNGGDGAVGAYNHLKLPEAGTRYGSDGSLAEVGSSGFYWSSTVDGTSSLYLYFVYGYANMFSVSRAYGNSVRCIKNK